MKRLVVFVLSMILMLAACAPAFAEEAANTTIKISGLGTVSMKPEQAIIRLGVQEQADSVVKVQSTVNKKIADVVAALKDKGIAQEDISVGYLSVYTNYDYSTTPYTIVGYNASHQLLVKINDVSKAGEIIDVALAAGANQLDGIDFTSIDNSAAYKQALVLAIADANDKALAVAATYGKELGALVSVTEGVNYGYSAYPMGRYAKAEDSAGGSTEVLTGDLSVSASVDVTYELVDPK